MHIVHNSLLARYKSKLGSLKTGEFSQIRIFAENVYAVKISFESENGDKLEEMKRIGDMWVYDLYAPTIPCVLYYSFIIEADYKTFFYGAQTTTGQGEGKVFLDSPLRFQITVFEQNFKTPDWTKNAVMYQIFPDRFCRGNQDNLIKGTQYHERMNRRVILHDEWDETPMYTPVGGDKYYFPCDFFGGDLYGIEQNLDYLSKLGVTVIYLNPICEAASNHRYDTADYLNVDPILGSNYDFSRLCKSAESKGMKVIIDGVFSHTGSDSIYFNKENNYSTKGAYQGEESTYYSWYKFNASKDDYTSWWGFKNLPEVIEESPDWQHFVITAKNGVFYNWLNMGANGFRLDVADELPDEIIFLMRDTLKAQNSESFLLGEVWEDAVTKHSYGKNRRYALGNGLDSVMNYPFRGNCLGFIMGKITAAALVEFLNAQALNYPPQMYYSLMNLLSSHDVPRAKTLFSTGKDGENMSREEQAAMTISSEEAQHGRQLLKLATVLQFTVPGMPSIYYGDEQGLDGLKDPFNRGTFSHKDDDLAEFFGKLGTLRRKEQTLKTGRVSFLSLSDEVVCVLRYNLNNEDYFGNSAKNEAIIIIINNSKKDFACKLAPLDFTSGIGEKELDELAHHQFSKAVDLLNCVEVDYSKACLQVTLKCGEFKIVKIV